MVKAFNQDNFVCEQVLKLKEQFGLTLAVETGTFEGDTTSWLASQFDQVITMESNPEYFRKLPLEIKTHRHILSVQMDSAKGITAYRDLITKHGDKVFFFLDAHWGPYWPCPDELLAIAEMGLRPVILIHDVQVPGKPFGYDEHDGQPYSYERLIDQIEAIYGANQYRHYYNEKAAGACRGCLYIIPFSNEK